MIALAFFMFNDVYFPGEIRVMPDMTLQTDQHPSFQLSCQYEEYKLMSNIPAIPKSAFFGVS